MADWGLALHDHDSHDHDVRRVGRHAHVLAEGPVWEPIRDRALWVDIDGRQVWAATWPALNPTLAWESDRKVCAILPSEDGGMLVVESDRLVHVDAGGVVQGERVVPLAEGRRFNDATCDPRGRLVLGTLSGDGARADESLFRLDEAGRLCTLRVGLSLSNGIAFSEDGSTMYHVDTLRNRVDILDDDGHGVSVRGSFDVTDGYPDGIAVDAGGDIWVAVWGGAAVRRYRPDGSVRETRTLPARHVSSVAFVGPERDRLLVTSATVDLAEPQAQDGGVFLLDPGVRGLPVVAWAPVTL
ncbi:SMP-30/gluconolactonase/LRE family protein [Microbacterium sp. AK031]|uniref:SMP-30/gluconolactonase/LRE family protein n=1 Tax=Microbacterium sp. AK031 TaxID=2723076 RepID=UPI00216A8B75|nr:SMP-30/gluconolactonase/LRE family protein [Microbacterium sp. AK031]MCS3844078.1 sugar lactone lactonase YvrE [Microbacterium sp. AK031]